MTSPQQKTVPLCVDLDGTLIRTDVLWESLIQLAKHHPLCLFLLPFWLLRGRAHLKQQIAARVELDVEVLPYHRPFLEFLRAEHAQGRKLILATAADHRLAERVAQHLGIFDEVVASNGAANIRGSNKLRQLAERFGDRGFDYAGNSSVDLPVWRGARQAIVVNASNGLAERARKTSDVSLVFNEPDTRLRALFRAMRPHQWVKNCIVFVPLITSHLLGNKNLLANGVVAFVSFCFCASGVYLLNDLLDVEADRHHATKRFRPFASGRLTLPTGMVMAFACFVLSTVLAVLLPWSFVVVLITYFILTTSYSFRLKQMALLDVFFLAGLYTMRLIGGHAATGIEYSFWLLAFSMFLFLSLALVKRFTELAALRQQNKQGTKGRGYVADDLELVAMLGIGNGCLAVLVMALYVHSDEVIKLYRHPIVLLMVCPLLLYWISRVWLIAHRGKMHDDPIVFALKDGTSYLVGALTLAVLWLATGH